MRVLVQRVAGAHVTWVDGDARGATEPIGGGLACLVGFGSGDGADVLEPMADKLVHLRVFEDDGGRLNRSLLETAGGLLLVPQFTLYADCRKGRRPSFSHALAPEEANTLFEGFVSACARHVPSVRRGRFGATMQVHLVNDGPVTILLDSDELGLPRR